MPRRQHELCRTPVEIFLSCKVFNTSVDKFVEKNISSKANYTIVSTLKRFAPFRCKSLTSTAKVSFHQYHFGGFSRCTLNVCFASVMSYQRP